MKTSDREATVLTLGTVQGVSTGSLATAVREPQTGAMPALQPFAVSCPTCLAAGPGAVDLMDGADHPGVQKATCPTCRVTSLEYGLVLAMDAQLEEMLFLDRVDRVL